MSRLKTAINQLMDDSKQLHDELNVQYALGKKLAQDELEKAYADYQQLQATGLKIKTVADDTAKALSLAAELGIQANSAEELIDSIELSAQEVKQSFDKLIHLL